MSTRPMIPPNSETAALAGGPTTPSHLITVQEHILNQQRSHPTATGGFSWLLSGITLAAKIISANVRRAGILDVLGSFNTANVSGEQQQKLDVLANRTIELCLGYRGNVGVIASEELDEPKIVSRSGAAGKYVVIFDPLDGSSNIDVNVAVGSIFSVLVLPEGAADGSAVLQPGVGQLAAGYAIYGPSTQLVLTVGTGTHGFTLDREIGNFVLTHPDIRIPEETSEYSINASNRRFWEPPIARYVDECKAGKEGPRGRDFNTRWVASLVADVHRVLLRGGIYLYPRDQKEANRRGRLRLMYEANPMAMLVEQAGGAASTGRGRIIEVAPEQLHQRVPVILGSRAEVSRVERYHDEYDRGEDKPYSSPLFGERSLFVNV